MQESDTKGNTRPLTVGFIKRVDRPGRYGDGGHGRYGLALLVRVRAGGGVRKSWIQRVRVNGKATNIGLGPYPVVTLAEAREAAYQNIREMRGGADPRQKVSTIPAFRVVADMARSLHEWRNARTAQIWDSEMARFVFPAMGDRRVNQITSADVLAVVGPLWTEKRTTAKRVRQRIGVVMKHAMAQGWRADNPAGEAIDGALPRNGTAPTRHHDALPHQDVADAIRKVGASGAEATTKALIEFVTLTACRTGEARGATWDEIDQERAVWTIPADRMKRGKAHRIPLSDRAVAILRELPGGDGFVFTSKRTGKALSESSMIALLKRERINATMHGFRSSFRNWCADTNESRELAEAALAHTVGGTEGAYQRSDMFDRRRALMQRWADYVTKLVRVTTVS